jgi:hypothetical protein
MVVGHEGVWVVSVFLGKWERERERERKRKVMQRRGKKPFPLPTARLGEVEDV